MTRSEYKIFRKFHRCTWVYHHLKNGYHKAISNSIITCKTCKSFFSIKYTTSTMSYNQLHKRQKKLYYYKIITSFAAEFKMSKVVLRLWYFSNAPEHIVHRMWEFHIQVHAGKFQLLMCQVVCFKRTKYVYLYV